MTNRRLRSRSVIRISIFPLIFLCIGSVLAAPPGASSYTVKDLLKQCDDKNTDTIMSEVLGRECSQYIRGYTDALSLYAKKQICVPDSASRVKLIRKVYVNWATKNKDKHDWAAPKGLTAAIKSSVNCVN